MVRWWQRRINREERHELEALLARPEIVPPGSPMSGLAFAIAITIQLGTVVVAALAVAVWFTGFAAVLKVVVSVILGLLVVGVVPVRRRQPRPNGWVRSDAPALFALLDAVGAAIGSRAPDRVVVDAEIQAAVGRLRGEIVLTIGLPLWLLLDDDGRVAVLGHELGHLVNDDIRRRWLIVWSRRSASKWVNLFWPGPSPTQQKMQRRRYRIGRSGAGGLAGYIQHLVLAPFFAAALAGASTYRAVLTRAGHRAEYRADRIGALAGGTNGMAGAIDVLWIRDIVAASLRTAARRGDEHPLLDLPRLVAEVPEQERERLRRRAALRLQRVDDDHPPTAMRAEYIAATPLEPATRLDGSLVAAADAEVRSALPEVERELRTLMLR